VDVVNPNVPLIEFVVPKGRVDELVEAFDNSPVAHTSRAYSADGSAFGVRGLKVDGSEVEHEGLRICLVIDGASLRTVAGMHAELWGASLDAPKWVACVSKDTR
jgi:hypothetical protein